MCNDAYRQSEDLSLGHTFWVFFLFIFVDEAGAQNVDLPNEGL